MCKNPILARKVLFCTTTTETTHSLSSIVNQKWKLKPTYVQGKNASYVLSVCSQFQFSFYECMLRKQIPNAFREESKMSRQRLKTRDSQFRTVIFDATFLHALAKDSLPLYSLLMQVQIVFKFPSNDAHERPRYLEPPLPNSF